MSGLLAVDAHGLSKRYSIGKLESGYGLARRLASRKDSRTVKWAVNDVSFAIEEGQAVAIIGRNGAGKSTLLKVLARITEPTDGYVDVRGRVGALLELGTGFHGELTGRENIFLNGSVLGMRRRETRANFDDIVEFAGVGDFIDTPVKRYSSGMYVRLAFAVAAFLQPEILIVDEVLAVGDAEFQKRCLGRMNEVARDGRTVLFVSHNMQAVRRLCTRGILLENGKLVQDGPIDTVVRGYLAAVETSDQGERVWRDVESQPGDDLCRVVRVSAATQDGELSGTFLSSQPIDITLEFDLGRVDSAFTAGFDLVGYDSTVVFRTQFTDLPEGARPTMVEGRNVLTCRIPPGLLNNGRYSINVLVSLHYIRWIAQEEQVLQFDVIADHGDSLFLNGQQRPGMVSPILDWTVAKPPAQSAESAPAISTSLT